MPEQFRPQEGPSTTEHTSAINTGGTGHAGAPQFNDSFAPAVGQNLENPFSGTGETRQRSGSKDYTVTDEWDASKVPPSRFQQRKGSIYSTPGSRDGHVEKNKDRDNTFHETHTKLFGKVKEKAKEAGEKVTGHHRKTSSASNKSQ
ncbi:hypothetical protein JX265_011767 [Neoarthrinium moseri]|uniref:Uncharacterized protein n=1 Tax=Neoarthrinium moseri TaxID=1658444 RepID=A0A9P9WBH7_9PEZI|nr:uncharacterized protein JN550_002067 [Neoarthrinium moseri]KAI1848187.1 hypothetical protein JX266_005900 [Neoarthrinium moseri]KAI1856255.1 hypothetical protein JX265_011767 [Neoarthrinium moseri]KAI1875781.1 hypothetical protein JN550_002067 [Neoarthrinium moseri]